jgi:hypothetical protein
MASSVMQEVKTRDLFVSVNRLKATPCTLAKSRGGCRASLHGRHRPADLCLLPVPPKTANAQEWEDVIAQREQNWRHRRHKQRHEETELISATTQMARHGAAPPPEHRSRSRTARHPAPASQPSSPTSSSTSFGHARMRLHARRGRRSRVRARPCRRRRFAPVARAASSSPPGRLILGHVRYLRLQLLHLGEHGIKLFS